MARTQHAATGLGTLLDRMDGAVSLRPWASVCLLPKPLHPSILSSLPRRYPVILNFSLFVLVIAGSLHAQLATHTVPTSAKTLPGAGASSLPLGRTRGKIQSWYRGDNLPQLAQLGWAGWRIEFGTGSASGGTYKLEVVLANTPVSYSAFSSAYAANLGPTPKTFFALRNINFPATNYVHLDEPTFWVPGDTPFIYQGPHFVVQVDNQTTVMPAARHHTVDQFKSLNTFTGNPVSPSVSNCGGLLRPSYSNSFWTLSLSRAAPNQPVSFLIGQNHSLSGLALPFNLGPLGLTGCRLDVDALVNIGKISDANGRATFRVRYVHSSQDSLALIAQALHIDASNPSLPALTNVTSTLFGTTGYCNEITSRNSFGSIAEFGPAKSNTATIVLFR